MTTFTGIVYYKDGKEVKKMSEKEMRTTMKNIEDLINTFENTGDNGTFFIGDYSNVECAIYMREQQKEIERLNNIIDELEKELDKEYDSYITKNVIYGKTFKAGANVFREHIKYKLQELKGSDSNE